MSEKKFDARDTDRRYDFADFCEIIAQLRAPGGCPWDIRQTHESLKKCLVEETGEVLEAIDHKDDANLCEELGEADTAARAAIGVASLPGEAPVEVQIVCMVG